MTDHQATEATGASGTSEPIPAPDPMDELVYEVDDADTVLRAVRRGELTDQRLRHRSVGILFRDADGRILVHRRAKAKRMFPGYHDMFVAGMVPFGESYDEAAHREAAEEVGQTGVVLTTLGRYRFDDAVVPQCTTMYEAAITGPVLPQESEVEWFGFLTEAELRQALDEWQFCPDSRAFYQTLYLGVPAPSLTRFADPA